MKYFVALCVVAVAAQALTDEQKTKLSSHNSLCISETKADPNLVDDLKTGQFKAVNEPLKQYVLCVMKKANLISSDGSLQKDVALSKVTDEADKPVVEKQIDECAQSTVSTTTTLQDFAWSYATCIHIKNKKYSIFQ